MRRGLIPLREQWLQGGALLFLPTIQEKEEEGRMSAGALFRIVWVAAAILGPIPAAEAALVQPELGSVVPMSLAATAPERQIQTYPPVVRTADLSRAALPIIAAGERRAAQSGIPVPLPPALMLLGTAIASLLGLRAYRRKTSATL